MTDTDGTLERSSGKAARPKKANVFARLALFLRQVVAELRKVIWPTRKELIAYTAVVLVFVLIMAGFIAGLDFLFTKGVLFVFG